MGDAISKSTKGSRRGPFLHVLLAIVGVAAVAGFVALGNWQVERRAWKLELIEAVETRAHGNPIAAPGRAAWAGVSRENDAYRRVFLAGEFIADSDVRAATASELGTGYWILTPLRTNGGDVVYVNRGFVEQRVTVPPAPRGPVTVTGLLRLNEPGGGVLRENEPAAGRWYSRDVIAMGRQAGLEPVAPFFIDAEAGEPGSPSGQGPVGGLTVIAFNNNHLVYAITWYGLALLVLVCAVIVWREARR